MWWSTLALYLLVWSVLSWRSRQVFVRMDQFLQYLIEERSSLRVKGLAGHDPRVSAAAMMGNHRDLVASVQVVAAHAQEGRRSGWSILGSLDKLLVLLRLGRRNGLSLDRFRKLFAVRLCLGLGLAGLVRLMVLSDWSARGKYLELDSAALTGAFLVAAGALVLVFSWIPRPWIWDGGLTADGATWFHAHIWLEPLPLQGLQESLVHLKRRQLETGVDTSVERLALVDDWAEERTRRDGERVETTADLLPLAEILGIGAPASLILLVPVAVQLSLF